MRDAESARAAEQYAARDTRASLNAAREQIRELRWLVMTAPQHLGARQALHNEWLRRAREAIGPGFDAGPYLDDNRGPHV